MRGRGLQIELYNTQMQKYFTTKNGCNTNVLYENLEEHQGMKTQLTYETYWY